MEVGVFGSTIAQSRMEDVDSPFSDKLKRFPLVPHSRSDILILLSAATCTTTSDPNLASFQPHKVCLWGYWNDGCQG